MIFVTVGTEQYPFNRLLTWVEAVRDRTNPDEVLVVQAGACTTVLDGACHWRRLDRERFVEFARKARLVVSHCGEGSFLELQALGCAYVLVPRRAHLGEHIDDHQQELAEALAGRGVPVAWSLAELEVYWSRGVTATDLGALGQPLVHHLIRRYTRPVPAAAALWSQP